MRWAILILIFMIGFASAGIEGVIGLDLSPDITTTGGSGTSVHSDLSNLLWSVAGHIMDSLLDMNGFNITEIGTLWFDGGKTSITSDVNGTQWVEYT